MKKPVVLLTTGTRGDLQPFLALAIALREDGIPIRIASDPAFSGWTAEYDLPFIPVEGNPSALMTRPGGQSALTYDGNILRSLGATFRYLNAALPIFRQMLHSAWQACQGAAAVVVSLPTLWGAYIAEALGIPCIYALLQPFSRTGAFPCSLLPARLPSWTPLNRFSYFLVEQAIWLPWRGVIQDWLRAELHLPAASSAGLAPRLYEKGAVLLYAISSSVVPRPLDWPANHQMTGFWFLDPSPAWHPAPELLHFLTTGEPPIYFGFGSPGLRQQQASAAVILQALAQTAIRAVIHLPPGAFPAAFDTRRIIFTGGAPHAWLFPRCAGAVHHGGAGTTAAALRAGIPSLVVPLAADQFFWAGRIQDLRAGPDPLPQRSLDGPRLAAGLHRLVSDPTPVENARRLAAVLQKEGGIRQAVTEIKVRL